tara:strand:- start:412 stop:621 length:210 start_codon:yes stop_codon:yes gene_type:complete
MNHEALFQPSDALHEYDSDYNESDEEHVGAICHLLMHIVQYRLDVGRGYVSVDNMRHTRGNSVVGRCWC